MRPIWKGHITFGLVNVPVTLYSAEQRADLQLHMVDSRNFARIRYDRVNADTGEEVPWDQIVRGYEYADGSYVLLSDEELKRAAPEATKAVEIEAFVDLADIDLVYFDKPYYLEPGKKGEKGYALLRETLRESGKAGIARVVIRTRQYIAAMVPRGEALVLNLLRYHQELRSMEDLNLPGSPSDVGVTKAEIKMATTLVNSMARRWDPAEFHDEYREALMKWIDQKIESGRTEEVAEGAEEEEDIPPSYNIMEALKRSVEHAGAGRKSGSTRAAPPSPGRSKATRKSTAKKASAPRKARKKAG